MIETITALDSHPPRVHRPTIPECPRCGYDQSGLIHTWYDASPLTATCSECGYHFLTREILNPEYILQRLFFEHAKRAYLRSLFTTVGQTFRPWSFWRWVRLEHPILPARLWLGALMGMLLVHAAAVVVLLAILAQWYPAVLWSLAGRDALFINLFLPDGATPLWHWRGHLIHPMSAVTLVTMLLIPAAYLVLTDTLKVRRTHLIRIFAYGLVPLPLLLGMSTLVVTLLDDAYRRLLAPGLPTGPGWLDPGQALTPAAIVGGFLYLWWGLATSRYLQLPRPWTIAATLLLVSGLGALLCVVLGLLALK